MGQAIAIGAAWLGVGAGLLFAHAAQTQTVAPAVLPVPSGAPQDIAPATDPLISLMRQTDGGEMFRDAIAGAAMQHPRVKEAVAAQREARGVRMEARSAYFPRIDLNLFSDHSVTSDFHTDRDTVIERSRPQSRTDAQIAGEQLVTDFGATSNRVAAAGAREKATEADVRRIASDVALRAIAAYYDVLAYQALVDIGQAYVDRHRDILGKARARFQQGYGSDGDVARAEAYAADAENRVTQFERQLAAARARYIEAAGNEPPLRLARPATPGVVAGTYEELLAASAAIPRVEAEKTRADGARREWRAARSDELPRLSAMLDATQYDILESHHDYDVRGRIVFRYSIFGGGRMRARTDQALQRFRQAESVAERVENEAERDATIAWREASLLERQMPVLEISYLSNRRSRDLLAEQFRVARGTLLELLRAEQDYFTAAAAYVQGSADRDLARYVLLERTGRLLGYLGVEQQIAGEGGQP